MYAIRHKKTNKWLYGTDYREQPYKQRTSYDMALTFEDKDEAEWEFKKRRCSKDFEIVKVRLEIVGD